MAKLVVRKNPITKKKRLDRRVKSLIFWIMEVLVALLLALIFCVGFCYQVSVQDTSMSSTLETGETVLVDRVMMKMSSVDRGDIIAYKEGDTERPDIHIKRVIGLPGETVLIHDGIISINGETYIENNNFPKIANAGLAKDEIKLGANQYFVLGDNRNNSADSRFADVGNIEGNLIIGKVWFRLEPRTAIGFVK